MDYCGLGQHLAAVAQAHKPDMQALGSAARRRASKRDFQWLLTTQPGPRHPHPYAPPSR